jgi:hypothetical protein
MVKRDNQGTLGEGERHPTVTYTCTLTLCCCCILPVSIIYSVIPIVSFRTGAEMDAIKMSLDHSRYNGGSMQGAKVR